MQPNGDQPVVRQTLPPSDGETFERFKYFWADALSNTFFYWTGMSDEIRDSWLEPWGPAPQF